MFRRSLLVVTAAAAMGIGAAAHAQGTATTQGQTMVFNTTMAGSQESPPTTSKGTGTVTARLDPTTHRLTYTATWSGFASPVIAAHFHGPATAGQNAPIVVPIDGANPKSPVTGSVTLTAEQQQQLTSGQWYANVHTKNNPKGAIRGQMTQGQ